jgi:hypothetical protein
MLICVVFQLDYVELGAIDAADLAGYDGVVART